MANLSVPFVWATPGLSVMIFPRLDFQPRTRNQSSVRARRNEISHDCMVVGSPARLELTMEATRFRANLVVRVVGKGGRSVSTACEM